MQDKNDFFRAVRESKDFDKAIEMIPYANFLGVRFSERKDGSLLFRMPFDEKNVGNTALPALHGGVIAGFMENAAVISLMWAMDSTSTPKIIDFNVDYTLSGRAQETYARCDIVKLGRRIANVQVTAYQDDPNKAIAVARSHFKLVRD
ncbi:MAG: PaaI family thioesterase [Gammaproteobacteria bacterium]|nr:PaaI family thioesterase [Gammaproteobacteria bacterium]